MELISYNGSYNASLVLIGVGIGIYFLTRYFSKIKKQKIEKGETVQAKIISVEDVIRNIRTARRVGTKHWGYDVAFSFTLSDGTKKTNNLLYNIENEGYKGFEVGQVEELFYNREYDELIKPRDPWLVAYILGYGFGIMITLLGLFVLVLELTLG